MAFDTKNERRAMNEFLFSPVPWALPDGDTSWSPEAGAMMVLLFPTDLTGVTPPGGGGDVEGTAQITHMRRVKVIR